MDKRQSAAANRHYSDISPEFIVLGLLSGADAHGYEIFRRFRATLGSLWHISESQMYAMIKRMEARGLLSASGAEEKASRRVLSLTPKGAAELDEWLSAPTPPSPRRLRLEFITRVHFAKATRPERVGAIFDDEIAVIAGEAKRLAAIRRSMADPASVESMGVDFRINQLKAIVSWLRRCALEAGGRA